ncbi:hypothetical protein FKR81_02900 [Lentzea tibetensis]|uniref:DoxX family protein n=1 Tax=Lentzea tibetensis TaxID=2591470 RepID=A0A563F1U7_9PSEU|nr:DoxX family protein [Lentzea tibetensis]TWP53721.1 hypothetical protein FKR81_02900 [Lentzea tibetensis]
MLVRITALVLGVFFAGLGAIRLLPVEFDQEMFAGWGVPMWLRTGAAITQLLSGVLLLVPRTRAVGAVGIFTIMVSAGTVHAMLGHDMAWATLYCGLPAVAAAAVAWACRGDLATLGTASAHA